MKVLQINSFDFFSTGNIMLQIADVGRKDGIVMYTAAKKTKTSTKRIKENNKFHYLIGCRFEHAINRMISTVTDLQDFGSIFSTISLINHIRKINPDIIHIHDLAGYYINLDLFFQFLSKYDHPIVWTLHCCWAYTGRCIYYDYIGCSEWQHECKNCKQSRHNFPKHLTVNLARYNFRRKKKLILSLKNLHVVAISKWMEAEAKKSYLNKYRISTIYDGIDLDSFYPEYNYALIKRYNINERKIILGVASIWSERKGLKYFIELNKLLELNTVIVLIGLNENQIKNLPTNIIGIKRTFDVKELRNWYTSADVFVNPTMEEGLGLVNIEAQACGTPVVTFATGGAKETVTLKTGRIVNKGDVKGLLNSVNEVLSTDKQVYTQSCIEQARKFNKQDKYKEYIELYRGLSD